MKKIDLLRNEIEREKIKAYVVPSSDPHLSEYLPEHYKERAFLTGFTGSNGLCITTMTEGKLWTDGRYFIQAEMELKDSGYDLMKMATPGYPTYVEWLKDNLKSGDTVGLNALYFSKAELNNLSEALAEKGIKIVDLDLVGRLWKDRPDLSKENAFVLEDKYAGKSASSKIKEVRSAMSEAGADVHIVSELPSISWTFNIRGRDILFTPVLFAYASIEKDRAILFTDLSKITDEVMAHLKNNGVEVREYNKIFEYAASLKGKNVLVDKNMLNSKVYDSIAGNIVHGKNPAEYLKAIKNDTEIKNQLEAHKIDCVALTKYFHYLKTNVGKININEYTAQEKLHEFRAESPLFIEESFGTISAYGPNAAMMHYSANENKHSDLKPKSLYLVDSGGQYFLGTTDITRTIALGPVSDEEKRDFTNVLKSHINLASFKFLKGTTGHALDAVAREPLWRLGQDYKCGTGHGVGYLLGVHEGPHGISTRENNVAFAENMVITIEPGIYKENKHGIRTENDYFVKKAFENENGEFLEFETFNYLPIDLDAIDPKLLTEDEKAWLNDYHKKTYELLKDDLDDELRAWLKEYTRAI